MSDARRARDLRLLDAVDALPREPYRGDLWRVVRAGRDPLQGGVSPSRWCTGDFDVLYTSLELDGAIAEIHALLNLQPVFPSKIQFRAHRLHGAMDQALHFADLTALAKLGVDTDRYSDRDYSRTQDIADAARFLGFDGLLAPSARWACLNAILFTDKIDPASLTLRATAAKTVDWPDWRRRNRAKIA